MDQKTYFWLMLGLSIITIISGIIIVCAPNLLRGIMNFVLGFLLLISGISAILNAVKNKSVPFIGLLVAIGILAIIFGIILICGKAGNFIGTIVMWLFALRALMRGCILIFNGIQNKSTHKWWIWEIIGGGLLLILAILTAFNTGEAASLVGVCIGLSTIFDGIAICLFSFQVKNGLSIQSQVIQQATQKEIGQ